MPEWVTGPMVVHHALREAGGGAAIRIKEFDELRRPSNLEEEKLPSRITLDPHSTGQLPEAALALRAIHPRMPPIILGGKLAVIAI